MRLYGITRNHFVIGSGLFCVAADKVCYNKNSETHIYKITLKQVRNAAIYALYLFE